MTNQATTFTPKSVHEVSGIVRDANHSGQSLVMRGGGTALDIGNRAIADAALLDIAGISGVIDYRPADLTISVHAGTHIAEIRHALAEHGQELPVDVPLPDQATIGGLVACGFAGPRRLGSGTLKDLILGCEYVRGDGLIAKAGGQVVKNVSGFEIPRLLHGSWGALAVLSSINFKVTPIPKAERTLIWPMQEDQDAYALAQDIRSQFPSITAMEIETDADASSLAIRLMGRAGALDLQVSGLVDLLGATAVLSDLDSATWWQDRNDRYALAGDDVQIVVRTRPRYTSEVVAELGARLGAAGQVISAVSPGLGVARLRFPNSVVAASNFWQQMALENLPGGTEAIVEFAPDTWKHDLNVWGPNVPGRDLMLAVKAQFDPGNIFNRGRLFI